MLVFQSKEMAAMMVYQTNPPGIELYFYGNKRPFYRYGGHFDFYCFEYLLWDEWQIHINLPPEHPIMSSETIEIKMAAVSAKRSISFDSVIQYGCWSRE